MPAELTPINPEKAKARKEKQEQVGPVEKSPNNERLDQGTNCAEPPKKKNFKHTNIGAKRRLDALALKAKAVALRRSGLTFRQIAKKLGFKSVSSAHDAVMSEHKAMAEQCRQEQEMHRAESLDKLDYLWRLVMKEARTGNPKAIMAAVAIDKRRASLLGLDAPQKIEAQFVKGYSVPDCSPDAFPDPPKPEDG